MLPSPDPMPSGAATGIAKTYRTGRAVVEAVRGIDLTIARGETVALLGPNGAGKSTTIDILLGLAPPDRGRVAVLGRAPRDAVAGGLVAAMLQAGALMGRRARADRGGRPEARHPARLTAAQ